MNSKSYSFKLELTTLEGELVWEFARREGEYVYPPIRTLNEKHKIPNPQALQDVLTSFHQIEKWDLEQIQSFGSEACQSIFPPKLIEELKKYDTGYILFLVPPDAADIPFEFFFIPERGFLSLIFQTSICINYVSPRNRHPQLKNRNRGINTNHKFLIISNPDDDQTAIHNEVKEVKNFVRSNHFGTYSIATSNKEILYEEIIKHSIVHFASHSFDTSSAITNIEKSGIFDEFAIYPLPRLKKHIRPSNLLGGECVAISKNTSHPKLARKFIRFLMSNKIQKKMTSELWWPPNRMDVRGDMSENYTRIYEQAMKVELLHANPVPVDWYPESVALFNSMFIEVTTTDIHIGTIIGKYREKLVQIRRKKE